MKLKGLGTKMRRASKFIVEDVWDIEITSLTRMRAAGVKEELSRRYAGRFRYAKDYKKRGREASGASLALQE